MSKDVFKVRGNALEEEYFRRIDEKLALELREKWQHERDIEALKKESRIDDTAVIEEMLHVGIHPGMIQALTLVPALHVAWANGYVEKQEREAVLKAAESVGIATDSTTGQLLMSWLTQKPSSELFQAWEDYIEALHAVLDPLSFRLLHNSAVETARQVAEAAGGFLGVYSVSVAEERAIQQIDAAFPKAG
ncbi:MAG: hypothetical protein R3C59_12405 [Planctomycetaceae bacterium]